MRKESTQSRTLILHRFFGHLSSTSAGNELIWPLALGLPGGAITLRWLFYVRRVGHASLGTEREIFSRTIEAQGLFVRSCQGNACSIAPNNLDQTQGAILSIRGPRLLVHTAVAEKHQSDDDLGDGDEK